MEAMVAITSTVSIPRSRFIEWYHGIRPLPGADARQFFATQVEDGFLTMGEAAQLLERHQALEAQEAQPDDPEIPAEVRAWLISQGWQQPGPPHGDEVK